MADLGPAGDGSTGLRELGSRLIRWRVRWWWYGAAILGPALVLLAAAVIVRMRTRAWVDFSLVGASEEFPQLGFLGVFAVNTLTFGIGEEDGGPGHGVGRAGGDPGRGGEPVEVRKARDRRSDREPGFAILLM